MTGLASWTFRPLTLIGDRTFRWFCLMYFLLNFGQGVFPPLLPQVMDGLGLSFASAGLLGTAFGLARFLTDVPAGIVVERWGASGILHWGIAALLTGTLLSAWAPALAVMLVARGLVGLGSGITIVVSILFLMRRGPGSQRTRRGNLYEVAVAGGMAVSSWFGGAIAAGAGWRWGFVMAALAIIGGWWVAAFHVLPAARSALSRQRSAVSVPPPGGPGGRRWWPIVGIYVATFSLAVVWSGGIGTFLPLYGGQALQLTPEVLGRVLSIAYAIEAISLVPVGWMADTLGRVRVLVPGFLVMFAGVLLVPRASRALTFGVAATLVVSGLTVWMIPPVLLAERIPGGFRGPVAGLYRLVSDLGYIVAPGATGWLIGWSGFPSVGLAMATILGLSAAISAVILGRPHRVLMGPGL